MAQPYWTNTSRNGIVRDLIETADETTTLELAALASGGTVEKPLDLQTVFDDLVRNPQAVWPQMYQSGYVTTDDTGRQNDRYMVRTLRIPNLEVKELFGHELLDRSLRMAGGRERLVDLQRAVVAGDTQAFTRVMRQILLDTPSYHDLTSERDYHVLMLGLLYAVDGYRPALSNRESGDGRCDVLLEPQPGRIESLPAIAMELKFLEKGERDEHLEELLAVQARDVALAQAIRLAYGSSLAGKGLMLWGVSFAGKYVSCACVR